MLSLRFFTILFISSFYIWVAPYTKVEESYSLQAIHDFIYHRSSHGSARISNNDMSKNSSNIEDGSNLLRLIWDHEEFPGMYIPSHPLFQCCLNSEMIDLFLSENFSPFLPCRSCAKNVHRTCYCRNYNT